MSSSISSLLELIPLPPPPPPPPLSVTDLEDLFDWQQQLSLKDTVYEPFFLPPDQKIIAVLQPVLVAPPFINKIIIQIVPGKFAIQKISKKQLNFIQTFYKKQ